MLLHLVDASDPAHDDHIRSVEKTLVQLGLERTRRLVVLNKIDLLDPGEAEDEARALDGVAIAAVDRETLHPLLERIERLLWANGSPA